MFYGKEPQQFFDTALITQYNYKLEGFGKPVFHLGGYFFRDKDNTLVWGPSTYVKIMLTNYELMFNEKPKEALSPMVEKDHPELDLTKDLDECGIKQYQSLIGALQWLVTLGRFDILIGVTTVGSFRVSPRKGHLDRLNACMDTCATILMEPSASALAYLTTKVIPHPLRIIGPKLYMACAKKNSLATCLSHVVKLYAQQHMLMLI